jgi:predicted kinase
MRDRLKRRKKIEETAPSQPAPLQPAYFEPEPQRQVETVPEPEEEVQRAEGLKSDIRPDAAKQSDQSEQAAEGSAISAAGERRPRRRRRGGRGRRRTGSKSPVVPSDPTPVQPPAVEELPEPAAAPVSATPTPPVAHRPRALKGTVVLAIGLPGSGKSSWFKRHNLNPLSSDVVRAMLFDDPAEQRFQDLVFSNLRSLLRARLVARRPLNYVDATNLTPHDRHSWIKLAKDFGYEVQAVYFDVPLEVCLERNARRQRVVEDDVMRKMAAKLKPPTFEEGFSKITVVRVKAKE